MILCHACQHELPDNSRFCGYCGAKVHAADHSAPLTNETIHAIAAIGNHEPSASPDLHAPGQTDEKHTENFDTPNATPEAPNDATPDASHDTPEKFTPACNMAHDGNSNKNKIEECKGHPDCDARDEHSDKGEILSDTEENVNIDATDDKDSNININIDDNSDSEKDGRRDVNSDAHGNEKNPDGATNTINNDPAPVNDGDFVEKSDILDEEDDEIAELERLLAKKRAEKLEKNRLMAEEKKKAVEKKENDRKNCCVKKRKFKTKSHPKTGAPASEKNTPNAIPENTNAPENTPKEKNAPDAVMPEENSNDAKIEAKNEENFNESSAFEKQAKAAKKAEAEIHGDLIEVSRELKDLDENCDAASDDDDFDEESENAFFGGHMSQQFNVDPEIMNARHKKSKVTAVLVVLFIILIVAIVVVCIL